MRQQIAIGLVCLSLGSIGMRWVDSRRVVEAQAREAQANGLEDECRATLGQQEVLFKEDSNGDYRLSVQMGRRMVCEEKDVKIVQQPDAVRPLIAECKH